MANEFPYTEFISGATVSSIYNTFEQRSEAGVREVGGGLGHYYKAIIELSRMPGDRGQRVFAFLSSLQGRLNTFKMVFPRYSTINKTQEYTGTITVNGASQGGKQINVDGLPVSARGILLAGTFVKFENTSTKVYQLTADLDSDGAGEGVLSLNSLIVGATPNDNENVIFQDVEWTFSLNNDDSDFALDVIQRTSWSIELQEAWS